MFGLVDVGPDQLQLIHEILHSHLPSDTRVWAFGSRVRWETIDASDLDIAIEDHKPVDHKIINALNIAFDDSDLLFAVDVVDLKAVDSKFKKIIDDQKVLLVVVNSKFTDNRCSAVRLRDFAPFSYGKPLPPEKRNTSGNIPVVGSGGIMGYHDTGLTAGPAVTIGRRGAVGTVQYFSSPCWPTDATFYVTGDDPLLMRFKYYVLQTLGLEQMNFGSALPGLNRTAAHARLLSVPGKQEQRRIASILQTLDARIALNHKMNRVLESTAQAIFTRWFVDYEFPNCDDNSPYKSSGGKMVYNKTIGKEIPKKWSVTTVKKLAPLSHGVSLPISRQNISGHVPVFGSGGIVGYHDLALTGSTTVIVGCTEMTGSIHYSTDPCWPDDTTFFYTSKDAHRVRFAYYALQTMSFDRLNRDGIISDLDKNVVHKQKFCIPDEKNKPRIFKAFDQLVDLIYERIDQNNENTKTVSHLRDVMIPNLTSGKIRIQTEP